jgi:hypothetical protein
MHVCLVRRFHFSTNRYDGAVTVARVPLGRPQTDETIFEARAEAEEMATRLKVLGKVHS